MDLEQGVTEFIALLGKLNSPTTHRNFLQWLAHNLDDLGSAVRIENESIDDGELELQQIAAELRQVLPFEAQLESESIQVPSVGPNSDCTQVNTVHVDAFLYDDDLVDCLVEDGKLSRTYCKSCGSKDTAPLNFISHSASIPRLKMIFQEILPDLSGKVVLDIGSRLGAVLYGAYYFSKASKIIGIELNRDFVQLQQQIVSAKGFSDRIEVIHGDVTLRHDLLKSANVILLNNVFEFFVPPAVHSQIWQYLRREILPGTLLVTVPSIEDSIKPLNTGIDLSSWVQQLPPCNFIPKDDPEESEISEVKFYRVL